MGVILHLDCHTEAALTEDGVPEVARRARLGQRMKGIARTYDHVTPAMQRQIIAGLQARWESLLTAPRAAERRQLVSWFPRLESDIDGSRAGQAGGHAVIAISSPSQQ